MSIRVFGENFKTLRLCSTELQRKKQKEKEKERIK